jgi:predicted PhzF superfamily epimerase YddE/YHI9
LSRSGSADALAAVLIEAFATGPCAGNGAAVVLLEHPQPGHWMQAVAGSLRQSETAFLLPWADTWLLRWFTPRCEVPLCGHATLAALLALGHWGRLAPGHPIRFQTRSGRLPVELVSDHPRRGTMQLPGGGLRCAPVPEALQVLLHCHLGLVAEAFWTSELGYAAALLPTEAPLPDLGNLAPELPPVLRGGLVLMQALPSPRQGETSPQLDGEPADYRLRFYAPGLGIDEDPVTGSAHALVAPYWMERLGRARVVGWQCSDRPGGMVCEAGSSGMIRLTGCGHLLWDGTLRAQPPNGDGFCVDASASAQSAWQHWLDLDSTAFSPA